MTYRESAQLARSSLLPNRVDLRYLASDAKRASTSLEVSESLHIHNAAPAEEQSVRGSRESRNEDTRKRTATRVNEDERSDGDVLHSDERRLTVRAEREAMTRIVRQRDEEAGRLEHVRNEAKPLGGLRVDELQQLRDLDDGRGGDDADAERFGDGELHAGVVTHGEVQVLD